MRFTRSVLAPAPLLVLLMASGSDAWAQLGQARTGCDASTIPGRREAIIYTEANFQGDCRILTEGVYPSAVEFGLPPSSISSIKVGRSMQLHLFFEPYWKHRGNVDFAHFDCIRFKVGDDPFLGSDLNPNLCNNRGGGWNDKVNSLRLIRKSRRCGGSLGSRQVELYLNANFTGDCVRKDAGSYDFNEMGIAEESVSSFRVGRNVDLLICREPHFVKCNSYRAGTELPLVTAPPVENDTVSSFSVR